MSIKELKSVKLENDCILCIMNSAGQGTALLLFSPFPFFILTAGIEKSPVQ